MPADVTRQIQGIGAMWKIAESLSTGSTMTVWPEIWLPCPPPHPLCPPLSCMWEKLNNFIFCSGLRICSVVVMTDRIKGFLILHVLLAIPSTWAHPHEEKSGHWEATLTEVLPWSKLLFPFQTFWNFWVEMIYTKEFLFCLFLNKGLVLSNLGLQQNCFLMSICYSLCKWQFWWLFAILYVSV